MDKILIVDDNPKNIQVLANILSKEKYEIEYAQNGKEAIEYIEADNFDLVLMDVMMPVMNGFETCEIIRSNTKYINTPIIFLTAQIDKKSILKGFELGGQDYLTKPFDSHELLARVKTHIELKKSKEKLSNVNSWLEEQVAEKTKKLQLAINELKQLDIAKNDFLKLINTEIEAPLNGIVGPLQLLKSRITEEDLLKLLQLLECSFRRLENFSNDALLIAAIQTNKANIELEEENALRLVELELMRLSQQIKEKKININLNKFNQNLMVKTDVNLFAKSLNKAIKYGINYAMPNSELEISCEKKEERIDILICHQGKQFNENILDKGLKLFMHESNENEKDLRIDLFLVNLIQNALNGKMEFGNNESKGSYVKLILEGKNID